MFHWEIDDTAVAGVHTRTDFPSIESAISKLAPDGSGLRVDSVWTSAGAPDRYDVHISAEPPLAPRNPLLVTEVAPPELTIEIG